MLHENLGTILISVYFIVTAWLLAVPEWFTITVTTAAVLLIIWAVLRQTGLWQKLKFFVKSELTDIWNELTWSFTAK